MSAKITAALHAIMSQVSYVQKTGKNSFHNYSYAGEADLLAVLRPAMIEHGLMLFPSVENVSPPDENGNVTVLMSYTLVHKDGEVWPEKLHAAGMGNDRAKNGTIGDKGVYKAITGANKYLLFKLFQIETGDDPEVVSAHDKASEAPRPDLKRDFKDSIALESTGEKNRTKWGITVEEQRVIWAALRDELDACQSIEALAVLWQSKKFQDEFKKIQPGWQQLLVERKEELKAAINTRIKEPAQ